MRAKTATECKHCGWSKSCRDKNHDKICADCGKDWPESSKTWQCMECGKQFNSKAKYEIRCPKCHGVDIDIN